MRSVVGEALMTVSEVKRSNFKDTHNIWKNSPNC